MGELSCSTPGGSARFPDSRSCCWCWRSMSPARRCAMHWIRASMTEPLLTITDLRVGFPTPAGLVRAVDGVTLEVREGECLGVVGESGSGKSVTFAAVMGLIRPPGAIDGGNIRFDGRELVGLNPTDYRR